METLKGHGFCPAVTLLFLLCHPERGRALQSASESKDLLFAIVKLRHPYAMLRPTAGAIIRNRCINSANCSGNNDCAPSESAWSGSGCTSISNASAPAASDAHAIGATLSRNPVPCDGSDVIGRCDSLCTIGIAEISSVLRVYVSKVRIPRSHRIMS